MALATEPKTLPRGQRVDVLRLPGRALRVAPIHLRIGVGDAVADRHESESVVRRTCLEQDNLVLAVGA